MEETRECWCVVFVSLLVKALAMLQGCGLQEMDSENVQIGSTDV
jgi:hypothetical protein